MRPAACAPVAALAFVFASSAARADDYKIDPERSELVARVFKDGVASSLAHDHVVRASKLSGTIRADAKNPGISISVETGALIIDEPEMRRKYKLEKKIGDGDREKIRATMLCDGQLDAAKYPAMTFESTRIEPLSGDRFTVTGNFTLHGKTRAISFPVETRKTAGEVRARGVFTIKQSDFGIEPYSAALGTIRNKDEVQIIFSVTAAAAAAPASPSR